MEAREQMKERLRAQEAWGKRNTAPLANKIYGTPSKLVDALVIIASFGLLALKLYLVYKGLTS